MINSSYLTILERKRATLILLFALLPIFVAQAQNTPEPAAEARGRRLLENTRNQLRAFQSVRIHFTYTMENQNQNVSETMKGEFLVQGDRYFMKLGENRFVSDGTNTWSYIAELNEVYINLLANDDQTITPTSVLQNFEEKFRARHVRQETHMGRRVEIIDLVPRGPHMFFKYRVAVDSTTGMIVYTVAHDREGGTYTYTIDRIEPNPRIAQGVFTFNTSQFPDVEVVDLR